MVHRYDLTPLFKAGIGFDRMADLLDGLIPDQVANSSYPPYNIEKLSENGYRITMAVAGFSDKDIEIQTQEDRLIISGRVHSTNGAVKGEFIHRGIAERAFERHFSLADNVRVLGASLVNGMLHIKLEREIPEHKKPRRINIDLEDKTTEKKMVTSNKKLSVANQG